MASDESTLRRDLDELQKKLGKKQQFEAAVASISSIVRERYAAAPPSLRNSVSSPLLLLSFFLSFVEFVLCVVELEVRSVIAFCCMICWC